MLFDIAYKLVRKALPRGFFGWVSGVLGRHKAYHRPQTYRGIYDYYRGHGLTFKDKTVLEVGPGSQLFTAFHYLSEGARRVLVADPKVDPASAAAQLARFNALSENPLDPTALNALLFFRDTGEIPASFDGAVDLMCSHNVLEHIPALAPFYADVARLLAPAGQSCHRVDVSDHTYHLFSKFRPAAAFGHGRSLFHLRYSEKAFRVLGDDKTYMNRRLLPVHRDLIRRAGLRIAELQSTAFRPVPVHPDLLRGLPPPPPEDLYVTDFFVRIEK